MNTSIIKKERRALRSSFAATIGMTILSALVFNGSDAATLVAAFYCFGGLLMAATIFGSEFSSRTMPMLLSQPMPREKIWSAKMRELGLELLISFVVLILSLLLLTHVEARRHLTSWPAALGLVFIPVCAFCSTPFFGLRSKNILGAVIFTVVAPFALLELLVILDALTGKLLGRDRLLFDLFNERHPVVGRSICVLVPIIYCAVLYRSGYRVFLNFEAMDSQGKELALPAAVERTLARGIAKIMPGYSGPFASLIRKELRLQRVSFIFAAFIAVGAPLLDAIWMLHHSDLVMAFMMVFLTFSVFVIPFLAALVTVAEERNVGILGWQMMLPVAAWKQWAAKMLTALFTWGLLGVGLPMVLLFVCNNALKIEPDIRITAYYALLAAFVFALVIFASAISSNVQTAMAAAVGLMTACGSAFAAGIYAVAKLEHFYPRPKLMEQIGSHRAATHMPFERVTWDAFRGWAFIAFFLLLPLLNSLLVNYLSYLNFKSDKISARRAWTQAAVIVCFAAASALLARLLMWIL